MKSRLLGVVAVLALLAACGDDDAGGRSFDNETPAETQVALFVNDSFVEFDTTDTGAEGSTMYFSLIARGFQVDTFSTTDSAAVAAILADADVLVLPEPEVSGYAGLPAGAKSAIRNFVEDGGTLAWFDYADEMNSIFGWSIDWGPEAAYDSTIVKAGSIAPFIGPDTLPWADATDILADSTLPAGTRKLYTAGGHPALAVIPVDEGEAVFFGYDWYDAAPFGTQDGGWINLLDGLSKF